MTRFASDVSSSLWCNTHSSSAAAQRTSRRVEKIRLRLLAHFGADPDEFDLVFVANATAGIKLVTEAFRDAPRGFWLGYHYESHTSIVGARELAAAHQCYTSDHEVEHMIGNTRGLSTVPMLFAYPAESNMNGRRLPVEWTGRLRNAGLYTLLDAAAFASTAKLDLGESSSAPDFVVLSLYKIFGFPDIGALIVRKRSGHVFQNRKYFGGGTVHAVSCSETWHARKFDALHEQLEDGSLPIHNIIAVDPALDVHHQLFGSMEDVSRHCGFLAQRLCEGLRGLQHYNGVAVCELYKGSASFLEYERQGPILAFNIRDSEESWISTTEVEKLAGVKNIQLRTGGVCNPGGVAASLGLSADDLKSNFAAGQRCGVELDNQNWKPTGVIRVSLGPENIISDVDSFLAFIADVFVEREAPGNLLSGSSCLLGLTPQPSSFYVHSLSVYPIKSCCGWTVPYNTPWKIYDEGLAWDREWCVVLAGSGKVMSQKRYARMALIRPVIDLREGLLKISFADKKSGISPIMVSLYMDSTSVGLRAKDMTVCEDDISARVYDDPEVTSFFSRALGVPCHLGRFPPSDGTTSLRHAKQQLTAQRARPGGDGQPEGQGAGIESERRPILLSNESPILVISRSSLDRLNEQIKANAGKAVAAEAFRANIVVAEGQQPGQARAYDEDGWRMMRIGAEHFELLGPCRRCQMVCIDQDTAEQSAEPLLTLAKTRRFDGKIFFGQHACHARGGAHGRGRGARRATIKVGDAVLPFA
jgi:molybdenum cofactor sulfurtransferase